MKLYDIKGKEYIFNCGKVSFQGGCSYIFLLENGIALKKYKNGTCGDIKRNVFNVLKTINEPNFVSLLDYYYEMDPNAIKSGALFPNIKAYTYEFVEKSNCNILELTSDYFLFNINELEKLISIFTNEGILILDSTFDNVIFKDDYMVLIDPDLFSIRRNLENLKKINRCRLMELFTDIFLTRVFSDKVEYSKVLSTFQDDLDFDKELTLQLKKKLPQNKKIIDYLSK